MPSKKSVIHILINNFLLIASPIVLGYSGLTAPFVLLAIYFTNLNTQFLPKLTDFKQPLIFSFFIFTFLHSFYDHAVKPQELFLEFAILAFALKLFVNSSINNELKANFFSFSLLFSVIILLFLQFSNAQIINFFAPDFDTADFLILKINRQLNIFALLLLPACYVLYQSKYRNYAIALFLLTSLLIFNSHSATAKFVFIVVIFTFLIVKQFGHKLLKILFILYCLGNLAALIILPNLNIQKIAEQNFMQHSFLHRLCIWQYSLDKISERPLGYGLNAAENKIFTDISDKEICIKNTVNTKTTNSDLYFHISHHPHYNILQILLELGIFGLLFFGYLLLFLNKKLSALPNSTLPFYTSLFYGYLAIGTTGFEIWQGWYMCSALLSIYFYKILLSDIKE